MKKFGLMAIVFAVIFGFTVFSCDDPPRKPTSTEVTNKVLENTAQNAIEKYPSPDITKFSERRTVTKWFKHWDVDNIVTYAYLFQSGVCLGYYILDGKPASTRSYPNPEYKYYMNGAVLQTPSLDGTYGEDNPGWVWFDKDGRAVSFQGTGIALIYSDYELPNMGKLLGVGTVSK